MVAPLRAFTLGIASLIATSGVRATEADAPAQYFVFERQKDGSIIPTFERDVRSSVVGPALGPTLLPRRPATRDADYISVQINDAAGRLAYQSNVAVPRWRRAEFRRSSPVAPGESNIESHILPADPQTFVVRVPQVVGGTLTLDGGALLPRTSFDSDEIAGSRRNARGASEEAQPLPGWTNGDPRNRVDLLVIGDGYNGRQRADFERDAADLVEQFFRITPYAEYRNYVNVSLLFVASAQAGADQPPHDARCAEYQRAQTCCSDSDAIGTVARTVNTAFDATFCSYGVQRALTIDEGKVFAAAAAVPDWDQILVVVNDEEYGGSGGPVAVVSRDPEAVDIGQHEYGHSFTQLADEYESPFPNFPRCSDTRLDFPRCESNVTDETRREQIKWQRWIAPSMPIPSFNLPQPETAAGLWIGARYLSTGMYREGFDCLMRSLGRPFCDVPSEAYVLRLYQGGWGSTLLGIENIEPDSENPPAGTASTNQFSATVLGPIGGPSLTVNWYLNDVLNSTAQIESGQIVSAQIEVAKGNRVALQVIDNSPILHPDVRELLATIRTWDITDPTGDANCDGRTSAADLTALLQLITGSDREQCHADADCNGSFSANDIEPTIHALFGTSTPCPLSEM